MIEVEKQPEGDSVDIHFPFPTYSPPRETETGNANYGRPKSIDLETLLQRRIGLCGDATRAPIGACRPQCRPGDLPSEGCPAQRASTSCGRSQNALNPRGLGTASPRTLTLLLSINYVETRAIN